jgi:hypothetical protein
MDDINVILADYPGLGRVRLCECNSIHLTIGPVTVHLSPSAFAQATGLVRDAMQQLTEIMGPCLPDDALAEPPKPGQSRLTH